MQSIRIDLVSDVVCPWCYLGKARLELAIAEVQDQVGIEVHWRPFQLNPDLPPEGADHKAMLTAKLGSRERLDQAHQHLTALGQEVGIAYDFDAIKISPNTLDAHRLMLWAHAESAELQDRLAGLLFSAYFEKGRNIGERSVLIELAVEAGLDRKLVETLLASEADKDTIAAEIAEAQRMGVSGVPFFIIDQQYAISGAQSVEVLAGAFREIAAMKQKAMQAAN